MIMLATWVYMVGRLKQRYHRESGSSLAIVIQYLYAEALKVSVENQGNYSIFFEERLSMLSDMFQTSP